MKQNDSRVSNVSAYALLRAKAVVMRRVLDERDGVANPQTRDRRRIRQPQRAIEFEPAKADIVVRRRRAAHARVIERHCGVNHRRAQQRRRRIRDRVRRIALTGLVKS